MAASYRIGKYRLLGSTVLEHSCFLRVRHCFCPLFIKSSNSLAFCKKRKSLHNSFNNSSRRWSKDLLPMDFVSPLAWRKLHEQICQTSYFSSLNSSNVSMSLIIFLLQEVKYCFHAASCAKRIASRISSAKTFHCVKISKVLYPPG